MPLFDPNVLGSDFACPANADGTIGSDLTADLRIETDGRRVLLEACYRRLTMASLFYVDDYGTPLQGELLEVRDDAATERAIVTELLKDERVQTVTVARDGAVLVISVTPHDAPEFPLTLTIDAVSGALVETT